MEVWQSFCVTIFLTFRNKIPCYDSRSKLYNGGHYLHWEILKLHNNVTGERNVINPGHNIITTTDRHSAIFITPVLWTIFTVPNFIDYIQCICQFFSCVHCNLIGYISPPKRNFRLQMFSWIKRPVSHADRPKGCPAEMQGLKELF